MEASSKVALITGGASGIGLAIAKLLSQRGWDISVVDFNREAGVTAAESINATFYHADVRDYAALSQAFNQTMDSHGRIDFVFSNAGITDPRTLYDAQPTTLPPEPDWTVIDINLKGAMSCAYLAQHYFRLTRRNARPDDYDPSLVFTSSIAGLVTIPPVPIYSAAKRGMLGFAAAIAPVFKESDGIRVSCICPGRVITNMSKGRMKKAAGGTVAPSKDIVPMDMVCEAVEMLISKDGGFGRCLKILPCGISDEWFPDVTIV